MIISAIEDGIKLKAQMRRLVHLPLCYRAIAPQVMCLNWTTRNLGLYRLVLDQTKNDR
ncbi:MAG: hypothetical protein PUP93_08905 [Rhizonema sp. NSF051]|nr:hypothetical protein [Rhizonema sp. NSF051]